MPENSFSAQNWNTADVTQNPVVAVRLSTSNDVPMIDNTHDHEYVLESDLIPAYPVIVVKDNERIKLSGNTSTAKNLNPQPCSQELSIMSYEFIDDNFNPCITYSGGGGSTPPVSSNPCNPENFIPGRNATVAPY